MITHIKGKLIEKNPTNVIVDCHGVGYFLNISLHTFSLMPQSESVSLYTHFIVKEDAHILYGFADKKEREVFRLLISVSGVGASIARTMLSSLRPDQINEAIVSNDVKTIQSVKGIGVKTAQRVILDLKDKILKIYDVDEILSTPDNTNKEEALSALETLGFNRKLAEKAINLIIQENPNNSVEEIIKKALKKL